MRATRILLCVLAIAMCAALGAADAVAQVYWVQSADYGYGNRRQDVTNTVRRLANGPNFKVNNNTMGIDPAVGRDKTLRIIGRTQNGTVRTFNYNEGQTVNAQMFAGGQGGGGWWGGGGGPGGGGGGGGGNSLRIMSANYVPLVGAGGRNVTSRLQSMVRNNRINIIADNQTMGGDPAPGRSKKLTVTYQYQGRVNNIDVGENGRLSIP
jgi:Domain of unknown function (DUF3395)